MHWFLWLIFVLVLSSALANLMQEGEHVSKESSAKASGMLGLCIAIGLLVYGGVI